MTNRSSITTVWATDGASQIVDPELDTGHPSGTGGAGKVAKGWVSQTEPQQWENFVINLRERRVTAVAENGRVPWDADVNYKLGSLTYLSGITYVSIAAGKNKNPATQTAYWSPVKFSTAAEYLATVADMQSKFNTHTVPGTNSHNDNIVSIGGSTKTTIDGQLQVVNDATDAHAALINNPHVDTATNIGTVPTVGGDFTGQVNYIQNLSLGTNCELMTNSSTFVLFKSNTGAIGIGTADYKSGGRWQFIFTEDNFPEVNQLYHPSFVLPAPDLHLPLMTDLVARGSGAATASLTRPSTLAYTDRSATAQTAPVNTGAFEISGLKLVSGTSIVVSAPELLGSRDGCISYTLNNAVVVKDVQFTNAELTSYFGISGNVKNFRVWSQRLTPRQKLHIPR